MADDKWQIVNKKGEVVGKAISKESARRLRDRHDNRYGGYEHSIRPPKKSQAETSPPWAKEGPGGRDFAQEDAAARLEKAEKLKGLKAKAEAWAAQEKADIGPKMAPERPKLTSHSSRTAGQDLGEKTPGTLAGRIGIRKSGLERAIAKHSLKQKVKAKVDPHVSAATSGSEADYFKAQQKRVSTLAGRQSVDPADDLGKLVNQDRSRLPSYDRGRHVARIVRAMHDFTRIGEKGYVDLEAEKDRAAFKTEGVGERTRAHHLQSREFPKTKSGLLESGGQSKDLGRATVNVIKSEAGKKDGGSLMKLAKKRQKAGQSIAGKPGNLEGSRNTLSNKLKGLGRLGGKLGIYGMGKTIIEGADTLRKLKSGKYDVTPEGGAKLKKGWIDA